MAHDIRKLHRRACEEVSRRMETIRDDQWTASTPCTEWNVRALVHHLVYGTRWVAPLVGGLTIAEVGDRLEGDLLGHDPKEAWRVAAAEATAACEPAGAMDRTVHLSAGPTPAGEYMLERVADLTIHAWDLARALGLDEQLDSELVDVSLDLYRQKGDLWRQWGLLGPAVAVPAGADAQAVFVSETGRKP
jgi:uncharacterized protein (TIGR03086 family)